MCGMDRQIGSSMVRTLYVPVGHRGIVSVHRLSTLPPMLQQRCWPPLHPAFPWLQA